MDKPAAKLEPHDLDRLRWLLGGVLALLSMLSVVAIEVEAELLVLVGVPLILGAMAFPQGPARLPKWAWMTLTPLLIIFIVSDFILAGGDFIPALVRMVLLLVILRAVQPRLAREDLQLILLGLFLLIISGVLSLELSFALQVMLFTPVAMAMLFVINLCDRPGEDPPKPSVMWAAFRWSSFARRLAGALDRRLILLSGGLFLFTASCASLLFIALPRFELGQQLPFLRLPTSQSISGFSDSVQFGDVVDILEDNTVAMRVDVPLENPPAVPYWRMAVLDEYYDGGFRQSFSARQENRRASDNLFTRGEQRDVDERDAWTFYLEGGVSQYLPMPGDFAFLRFQNRTDVELNPRLNVIATQEISSNVLFYQLGGIELSEVIGFGSADQALQGLAPVPVDVENANDATAHEFPQTMLAIPTGAVNEAIIEAALAEITQGVSLTPSAFAERTIAWLETGRGYSLQTRIPSGQADTILRWLQADIAGHCELYAGAFTILARAAGHPTRIITGFLGGDWNGFENYYMVRNRHAHAWCEIYEPGVGWIRVDPTPGNVGAVAAAEAQRRRGDGGIDRTFSAYLDSLRILWYRRVVSFDQDQQEELVEGLQTGVGALWASLRNMFRDWTDEMQAWIQQPWSGRKWQDLALGLGVAIGIWGLFRGSWWLYRRHWLRSSAGQDAVRRAAGRILRRWEARAQQEDHPLADALKRIPHGSATLARLQTLRFGPPSTWEAAKADLARAQGVEKAWKRAGKRSSTPSKTTGLI